MDKQSSSAAVPDGRYPLLIAIIMELLLIDIGTGLTTPVLPLYAHALGANLTTTGIIVGTIGISRALTDLPAGYLTTVLGRRKLLCTAPLLVFLAAATCAVTKNFWLLIPARLIEGTGAALVNTTAMVTLSEIVAGKTNRSRIMSYYQAARRGGNGFGPLLGGALADLLNFRAVYLLYALLAATSFTWALARINNVGGGRKRARSGERAGEKGNLKRFLISSGFILITAVAFTFFFGRVASRRLIIPLLGQQTLGLSTSAIGLALTMATAANLLTLYFLGDLPDRTGAGPIIFTSGLLSAAAFVAYALSRNLISFIAASLLWGFCSGFGGPARNIYLMDIAPDNIYPLAVGVYRTVADTGFLLGPFALGLLGQWRGFQAALYFSAALFCIVSFAFLVQFVRMKRQRPI